jgi:hypothetical protein
VVDFEGFRPTLDAALGYSDGSMGGRPPYDPVTMLNVLVLAAQNNVSDARMTGGDSARLKAGDMFTGYVDGPFMNTALVDATSGRDSPDRNIMPASHGTPLPAGTPASGGVGQ